MTKRTRSVIIDNTSGKIFKDVADPTSANASNLIATSRVQQAAFTAPGTTICKVVSNIGITGLGLQFPTTIIINNVRLTVTVPPVGASIQVKLKQGSSYETATNIGTYEIASTSNGSTTAINVTVASGNKIYGDILQVGSIRPGSGLSILITYYAG